MPLGLHLPDLLILIIILLVFGSKKLPETGEAIGKSIIAFKKGLSGSNEKIDKNDVQEQALLEQSQSKPDPLECGLVSKKASPNTVVSAAAHPRRQRRGDIDERLKALIVDQLGVDEREVVPNASFVEDLNADSLDLVELMMSLEEEFNLQISDRDAKKILTVQEAADYIKVDTHK